MKELRHAMTYALHLPLTLNKLASSGGAVILTIAGTVDDTSTP